MSLIDNDKEKNNFESPNIFSDKIISANLIRSIWFFNISPSVFYLGSLDKEKSLSIIDSICGSSPPIQCKRGITDIQYNWLMHCLRKFIAPQEPTQFDEFKLFITYLSKLRGNYVTNIKRFLSLRLVRIQNYYNNKNQNTAFFDSENDEIIIFQALFDLYTENPSLFYSLQECRYNKITQTFTTANLNEKDDSNQDQFSLLPDHFTFPECEARLIAKLGNRLFELCPSLSSIFLRALKNEDLEALFGLPCIYHNPTCVNSSIQFQKAFFTIRRFPLVSFFAGSNSIVALSNTSAVTEQHFVDLFMNPAIEFIKNSKFDEAVKVCSPFLEMLDFVSLLVIEKEKKSDDLNFMSHVVNMHFQNLSLDQVSSANSSTLQSDSISDVPSISNEQQQNFSELFSFEKINDLFQRFKGDVCVVGDVKNYLGTLVSISKLHEESIPKIFVSFLKSENFEPFEAMRSRILFSVNDEDWINDNDFVSGYFALLNTIKVIETNDESFFEVIEYHILAIQSIDFLSNLSIDIFSLLFLTKEKEENNEKENFFVNRDIAERILRILIDSDNTDDENNSLSPYLSSALRKIQFANVLYPNDQTVRAIMEPTEGMFALALEKKEIEIFNKIAYSNEKEGGKNRLKEIVDVAKQVVQFQQKSNDDDDKFNDLSNDSKIEIICSFELSQNEIKKLYSELNFENSKLDNEYQIILSNKQHIYKSSTELLQLPYVRLISSDFFHEVSERLSISSLEKENTWNSLLTQETNDLIDDKSYLYSFLSVLDALIPPLLQATNETVAKCLDFDPLIAVPQLVDSGKVEQASVLAKSLGYNVIEAIIKSGSTSFQCLQLLSQETPALSSCIALVSNLKKDEISEEILGNSHALSNLISRNDESEFELIDDVFAQDSKNQNGASIDEIHSTIISFLKKKPIPISQLSEILFRITEDDFIEITMKSKVLFNFDNYDYELLSKLCDLNGYEKFGKTIENFIYISRTTNRNPFPLEQGFTLLVLNSVYDKKSLSVAKEIYKSCQSFFNSNEALKNSIIELSKIKKWKEISQIIELDLEDESKILESLPKEIKESILSSLELNKSKNKLNKNIDFDDSAFFESVPESWNIMDTPMQTMIENASDKSNVLRIISLFPSIQESFNNKILRFVSKQAEKSVLPIKERSSALANNVRTFLPLINENEEKKKLIELALKQLLSMTSQLSIYDSHSELDSVESLNKISASLNTIQNESIRYFQNNKENEDKSNLINTALLFVSYFPCTKFNYQYSFKNFEKQETGEKILNICFKLDLIKIANKVANAWRLTNYNKIRDLYAIECVKLGIDKIPRKNKYKGFPVVERRKDESEKNEDDAFSIWKFATDRKMLDSSFCTSEESFIVRDFIDAYRHRSFYDSRICGRLTNLSEVDAIVNTEFQTSDSLLTIEQTEKDENVNGNVEISKSPSLFHKLLNKTKSKLFQSSSASFDINSYVDDDGELCNQHFYSRLQHLCRSSFNDESIENKSTDYVSSDLSELLTMYDYPSTEMTERMFPGTPAQLSSYLSARSPFYEEARYHASIGEFATALTILDDKFNGSDSEWDCFINDLFVPAVQRGRTGNFFSTTIAFLKIKDKNEESNFVSPIRKMITQLYQMCCKLEKMPFTQLGSIVTLGNYELAAYKAVEAFKESDTPEGRLFALDVSFASAATFVKEKREEKPIENSESIEKLRENLQLQFEEENPKNSRNSAMFALMKILHIQRRFCNSVDGGGLSIFDGAASIDTMTAFLLLREEFLLAVELMSACSKSVNTNSVASSLFDILANENDEKIEAVIEGMEINAPMSMFRAVVVPMVNRAIFFLKDERLAAVIVNKIKSMKLKCPLLILTDRLEDALKVASEAAPDYLPLIANYAARDCKLQILADAMRAIEKYEREKKI